LNSVTIKDSEFPFNRYLTNAAPSYFGGVGVLWLSSFFGSSIGNPPGAGGGGGGLLFLTVLTIFAMIDASPFNVKYFSAPSLFF